LLPGRKRTYTDPGVLGSVPATFMNPLRHDPVTGDPGNAVHGPLEEGEYSTMNLQAAVSYGNAFANSRNVMELPEATGSVIRMAPFSRRTLHEPSDAYAWVKTQWDSAHPDGGKPVSKLSHVHKTGVGVGVGVRVGVGVIVGV